MNTNVRTSTDILPFDSPRRELGVVVGFDGSYHAQLALNYGAHEAQQRGCALTVVSAFKVPPMIYGTLAAIPAISEEHLRRTACEAIMNQARADLEEYPGIINYRVEQGDAAGVLVEQSTTARVVIVGARGRGGFFGRLLGSVSSALPAHAHAPTIVLPTNYTVRDAASRDEPFAPVEDTRPVIVGVDGSAHGRRAALEAARVAQDRGAELWMTMALSSVESKAHSYPERVAHDDSAEDQRKIYVNKSIEAEATWVRDHYPDLVVKANVVVGTPVEIMIEQSAEAQLTVVGTRGHGTFTSILLGSTSRGVLYKARGPVMVVPAVHSAAIHDSRRIQPTSRSVRPQWRHGT